MEIKIKRVARLEILIPEKSRRVSNKWPAIIFAVKRIAKIKV